MQNKPDFAYDPKWETVQFKAPEKKIITFHDVEVFQKGKTHAAYLNFLAKLQEVSSIFISVNTVHTNQLHWKDWQISYILTILLETAWIFGINSTYPTANEIW